jgi:hypothetical protein
MLARQGRIDVHWEKSEENISLTVVLEKEMNVIYNGRKLNKGKNTFFIKLYK